MDLHLFIPITKVDVARRLVYGTVAEEVPDKSGEIMDYETAKPEFEAWSAEVSKASSGKSAGNLRAMHGSVAAGRLDRIVFDDRNKRIQTVAKVVDDAEWNKVLEGVYTGFSMGGKYKKRWRDAARPDLTRYTPEPMEVSLVDNPCIPSATFEVVKDDGSSEMRKFAPKPGDIDLGSLAKYGARHSKEDLRRVQSMHDTSVALGANCNGAPDGMGNDTPDDDGDEAFKTAQFDFGKFARIAIRNALEQFSPKLDELGKRLDALEASPLPGGPISATLAISKSQDASGLEDSRDPVAMFERHLELLSAPQRAHTLTKLALKNPTSR